ncbi:YesK family protein [Lysinibacillus sphaericus]
MLSKRLISTSIKGRSVIYTINFLSLIIVGLILAIILQLLQKYTPLRPFFHIKFFLALAILSAAGWVISFAIGGWNGMGLTVMSLSVLVTVLAGLAASFVLSMFVNEQG